MGRDELIAAGVPIYEETGTHLKQVCGSFGIRYSQFEPGPTTSMTLEHNLGK
jgi:hypothetical protein